MKEKTVSCRLELEIKKKLEEKAFSEGLSINSCIKGLIYEYLGLEPLEKLNIRRKLLLLDFGLQIGDYKKKQCKHNESGICTIWHWEEPKKNISVKFVKEQTISGKTIFHSEAIHERCAFCHNFEKKPKMIRIIY
jgi:hypothetical protein